MNAIELQIKSLVNKICHARELMIALLDAFNQYSLKGVVLIVCFTTLMLNDQKLHCKLFR